MSGLIFTAQPDYAHYAWDEITAGEPALGPVTWLADGVGLVAGLQDWDAFAPRFSASAPIFCRHIFPVQRVAPTSELHALIDPLQEQLARFSPTQTFSVQTRVLDEPAPHKPFDINRTFSAPLQELGYRLDVRAPEIVVSIVLAADTVYAGVSRAADNLSDWAGGMQRYRKPKGQISRAAFKLLEAFNQFALHPTGTRALDMGAAPGGWTQVLVGRGMNVVAVDPAKLHPTLTRHPQVIHVPTTIQPYLKSSPPTFDLLVNDMRMDALDSAKLTARAAAGLRGGGLMVMTLKLPHLRAHRAVTQALNILRPAYEIMGVKQLFHNRNEVTVAGKKSPHP